MILYAVCKYVCFNGGLTNFLFLLSQSLPSSFVAVRSSHQFLHLLAHEGIGDLRDERYRHQPR